MTKFIVSLALVAVASVASAKSAKTIGTQYARTGSDYTSSAPSYSSFGAPQHELTTYLTRGSFTSEKACKDCDTGTTIDVGMAYNYYVKDGWQVGAEARLQLLSEDSPNSLGESQTLIDLVGVGTYNFQSDLKSSFFAKAGVGLYSVPEDRDYETQFGFFLGGGKRFQLMDSITYTPEIRLVKRGEIDMGIEIALINFSLFWN